jgi:hypothetical protein
MAAIAGKRVASAKAPTTYVRFIRVVLLDLRMLRVLLPSIGE